MGCQFSEELAVYTFSIYIAKLCKGHSARANGIFFILFELQPVQKESELLDKLLHSHAIYTLRK